jgi:hypothetical protein
MEFFIAVAVLLTAIVLEADLRATMRAAEARRRRW